MSPRLSMQAKELGFDEHCFGFYYKGKLNYFDYADSFRNVNSQKEWYTPVFGDWDNVCTAPLYQQVVNWLESVHRISISRVPYTSGKHKWEIWKWNSKDELWESYTMRIETIEDAIQRAFELLGTRKE